MREGREERPREEEAEGERARSEGSNSKKKNGKKAAGETNRDAPLPTRTSRLCSLSPPHTRPRGIFDSPGTEARHKKAGERGGEREPRRERERLTNAAEPRPARKQGASFLLCYSVPFLLGAANAHARALSTVVQRKSLYSLVRGRQPPEEKSVDGGRAPPPLSSDCSLSLEQLTNANRKTRDRGEKRKTETHPLREATPAGAHCEGTKRLLVVTWLRGRRKKASELCSRGERRWMKGKKE